MTEDTVVELTNNKKYLILLESEIKADNYFLAVLLDENEKTTNSYTVLQYDENTGNVIRVDNALVLNELLADYTSQYEDLVEEAA